MNFIEHYDTTVNALDDRLSTLIDGGNDFEFEKSGDNLVVIFPDGAKFIISPNSSVNQLWVSANYEGHRFNFDGARLAWVDEKTGQEFHEYMSRLLSDKLGEELAV
jgi:iron donor protein CyaY